MYVMRIMLSFQVFCSSLAASSYEFTICHLSFVYSFSFGFSLVKFSLEKSFVLLNKESKFCLGFRLFKYSLFFYIVYIYVYIYKYVYMPIYYIYMNIRIYL